MAFCALQSRSVLSFLRTQQEQTQMQKTTAKVHITRASGREMFLPYGASCHGKEAKGDGPAASVLKVAPADLTGLT